VAWNESGFANAEFDALLDQANGIQDADARREIMAQLQTIMQEEGVTLQPYWRSLFRHAASRAWSTRTCIRSSRSTSTTSASKPKDLDARASQRGPGVFAGAIRPPDLNGPRTVARQTRPRRGRPYRPAQLTGNMKWDSSFYAVSA
jgi:hypothetical protein